MRLKSWKEILEHALEKGEVKLLWSGASSVVSEARYDLLGQNLRCSMVPFESLSSLLYSLR